MRVSFISILLLASLAVIQASCTPTLPPPVPETELGNLVIRAETAGNDAREVAERVRKLYETKRNQIEEARALLVRAQDAELECEELVETYQKKKAKERKVAAQEAAKKVAETTGPAVDINKYSPSDAPIR